MKKLLFVLSISFISLSQVIAQGIEITPITGYTFQAGFNTSNGRAFLRDGQNWGGSIGYTLENDVEVELAYNYLGTSAIARSVNLQTDINTPAQVHYATIGANKLFPTSDKVTFFTGIKLGTGTLAFPESNIGNITKFTTGFQGGVKIFPSDKVGIRLQANLMMPIVSAGTSLWWSPGGGTSVGVTGWSPIVQFGFTGGLIFRLGN